MQVQSCDAGSSDLNQTEVSQMEHHVTRDRTHQPVDNWPEAVRHMRPERTPNEAGFVRQTRPAATPHGAGFNATRGRFSSATERNHWRFPAGTLYLYVLDLRSVLF